MALSTATLTTTTTTAPCAANDTSIVLASLVGVAPGVCLFVDAELLCVTGYGVGTAVSVLRGRGGSSTRPHGSGATVYIGRADQFYDQDPMGTPETPPVVLPWINTVTGSVWQPVGDETGPSAAARYWQRQIPVTSAGALGANQTVTQGDI